MAEASFKHSLIYPDVTRPTLSEIANTLVAHEKIGWLVADLLEELLDGVTVDRIEFNLDSVEIGSLWEHFFVAIFIIYQEELDKELPELIEALTGYKVSERYDTLVTVLVLLLLFWGVRHIQSRLQAKKSPAASPGTPAVQGDYNTYINIAAEQLNLTPEHIEHAVEAVASKGNRRQVLSRAAIDLFRPAKRGGNGRIVPKGTPEVSPQTVAEFPNEAALADLGKGTDVEPHHDVVLEIRATDRDKRAQGWAGILNVEGLERRVPITLFPTIDVATLAQCRRARVDVMVEMKDIGEDERAVVRIHVIAVHECLE
jgi:hypothetical protein